MQFPLAVHFWYNLSVVPRWSQVQYIHFDTIDSTHTWTKQHAHTLDPAQLTCVVAQQQTAGRGRGTHRWVSPHGQNLYLSLYFTLPHSSSILANLGQLLTLSCAQLLQHLGFQPKIRWPNDLLLEGKKVAGVLGELLSLPDRIGVLLGIGLNCNMYKEILDTIDQPATSLAHVSGHAWPPAQILESLVSQFLADLCILEQKGFSPFHALYDGLLLYKHHSVTLSDAGQQIQGILQGIDEKGGLCLLRADGTRTTLFSGEYHPSS